jgi:hypothetical protein
VRLHGGFHGFILVEVGALSTALGSQDAALFEVDRRIYLHFVRLFLVVANLIEILFLLDEVSFHIIHGSDLFCLWNVFWKGHGIFLLAELIANFLRLLLVALVDVVHDGRDALEICNELRLRYLFIVATPLFLLNRDLGISWHLLSWASSSSLLLLIVGMVCDVTENKNLLLLFGCVFETGCLRQRILGC